MEVCLELFLLDNFLMDTLILCTAGAMCGKRQRAWGSALAAALGAIYAAVSFAAGGIWSSLPVKVLLSVAMITLSFRFGTWRDAAICALCFYLATALAGGITFATLSLLGGAFDSGAFVLPDTLRPALLAISVAAVLPRFVRRFLATRRLKTRAELRIHWPDRIETVLALVDTGSTLTEPISGLSVIIVSEAKMPPTPYGKGRAVVYTSLGKTGVLWALKPKRIELRTEGGFIELDTAYAARAPTPLRGGVDAIVGAGYLSGHLPVEQQEAIHHINSKNAEG